MAEDLSEYLEDLKINVRYIHSEVETFEAVRITERPSVGKIRCSCWN